MTSSTSARRSGPNLRLPRSAWPARLAAMVAITLGFAAAPVDAAPTSPIQLAPHRAVYEITLDRTSTGAGIVQLTGLMVYELKGSPCEGYVQTMRFVTRTTNGEGAESVTDLRSAFWEAGDAVSFRFDSSQYRDDKLMESAAGQARRPSVGVDAKAGEKAGGIPVEMRKPQRKKITISGDVLFPIQHSIAALEAARRGERVFAADLYDGSEKGTKVYLTTAVFGDRLAPGHNATLPKVENGAALDGLSAWPISLSYFDKNANNSDAVPSYEMAYLFFENGVARKLFIDYGEFAIRGQLNRLTMLTAAPCPK